MHHALSCRRRARYAIMVSKKSGLGDRLTCAVSVALYAVLTGRAFQYDWHGQHSLWNAYRSGHSRASGATANLSTILPHGLRQLRSSAASRDYSGSLGQATGRRICTHLRRSSYIDWRYTRPEKELPANQVLTMDMYQEVPGPGGWRAC